MVDLGVMAVLFVDLVGFVLNLNKITFFYRQISRGLRVQCFAHLPLLLEL